jgi:hypothetical protein
MEAKTVVVVGLEGHLEVAEQSTGAWEGDEGIGQKYLA